MAVTSLPLTPGPTADWSRLRELFDAALALPAADRDTLLADPTLDAGVVAEVRSLLAHAADVAKAESAGRAFLEPPSTPAGAGRPLDAVSLAGQALGPWRLVAPLGAGGMGEVWRAERNDGRYQGSAAVKLLKRGMDSDAVLARFAHEQQALARLSHPHIARLLDAGRSPDGRPYFVMELVEGQPLDRACEGLALQARLQLFLQLADAVAHAHRNLLVHRDLKPGNVLVDGQGQVKLLDFGIAKALSDDVPDGAGQEHTQQGQRPFTPQYASPEQLRGEPVSTVTDVYSLGVLLYLMLTGRRPHGQGQASAAATARAVLEEEPLRPSRVDGTGPGGGIPPRQLQGDLDNIVSKALEKTVQRRYASVDALAADVRAYLAGYPIHARPASAGYLLGKFVRRNRWAVAAGLLGGLGLATGLAAALMQERYAAALGALGLAGGLGLALLNARQATVARDLAQTRLTETRAIVSDVMTRHADAVQYLPGGVQLKAEVLTNMIGHLDRLAAQSGSDAAFDGELAMAYARLAEIQADNRLASVGLVAESERNAAKALALFPSGEAAHRDNPRYGMWWGHAWRTQAQAARGRGDLAAALRAYAGMEAAARKALQRHPRDAALLSEIGSAHVGRGHTLDIEGDTSLGRTDDALAEYAAAEAIYQRLVDEAFDGDIEPLTHRHQLGTIAGARALVCLKHGRMAEALAHGERAVSMRRAVLAQDPGNVAFRNALATESINLAAICLEAGDAAQALLHSTAALALLQELVDEAPTLATARQALLHFSLQHGRALLASGRAAEACGVLLALAQSTEVTQDASGRRRQARAWLDLARARSTLTDAAGALDAALRAQAAFEQQLVDAPADADGWLFLAQTQGLLHALQPTAGWPARRDTSLDRARATGPLNALRQRMAAQALV